MNPPLAGLVASAAADALPAEGLWSLLLAAAVDETLAGYDVPDLALFGVDPGPDHPAWLAERIPDAVVEVWDGSGLDPHLVDPDALVARLRAFRTRH